MSHRIKRKPPLEPRSRVSQPVGDVSMSSFMKRQAYYYAGKEKQLGIEPIAYALV